MMSWSSVSLPCSSLQSILSLVMKGVQLTINETLSPSSLQARIDGMGMGLFHMTLAGVGGMVVFFRGASLEILKSGNFSPLVSTLATLCTVLGLASSYLLGSLTGRRFMVVFGLCLMGVCSYLASICVAREYICLNGGLAMYGCGLSLAPCFALTVESFPSKLRGLGLGIVTSFYMAGEVFVAGMDSLITPVDFCASAGDLICIAQVRAEVLSVPMIVAAITAIVFLQESPYVLLNDCYSLNALLSTMSRDRSTQFRFSPGANMSLVDKKISRTELVVGLLFGAALTYLNSWGSENASPIGLLAILVCVLTLSAVPVSNPRIACMAIPFLVMTLMCVEGVVGVHAGLELLSKSLALTMIVFGAVCWDSWTDRNRIFAFIFLLAESVSVVWPLFVRMHKETEEIAFAVIFGLTGMVAVLLLPTKASLPEDELEDKGPLFVRIPIVGSYDSLKSNKI
jgi:hypothetical protein